MKIVYLTAVLFGILLFFQFFSGIYLFVDKYGFSISSINEYINGNEEKYINPKTLTGLIETAMPHFLAIFLTVFFIAHLFYFFKIKFLHFLLSMITFLSGFLDIISNLLILKISKQFAVLKIVSFITFEAGLFLLLFLLFRCIYEKALNS